MIVSSGAGLDGSPLSGGYAGAKRTQMFLARYLQREPNARGLGIRFVALAPRQLLAGTRIGDGRGRGLRSGERRVGRGVTWSRRFPVPLDADGVARAILAIARGDERPERDAARPDRRRVGGRLIAPQRRTSSVPLACAMP